MIQASVDLWPLIANTDTPPTDTQYNSNLVLSDMGRAGIVMVVSALDDYFTRRFAECVVPLLKKGSCSKKLYAFLESCGLNVGAALELLTMDRPYRRIRKLVDDHLSSHVTQRFRAIDNLYANIGIPNLSEGIEKRAKRKTLRRSIEKLVSRRHMIAHQGDLNKHGKVVPLSYKETLSRIESAKLFVDTADVIIQERMAK